MARSSREGDEPATEMAGAAGLKLRLQLQKPIMTTAPVSPLRQRMIDDMRLRQYGEKTQHDYVREVAGFAQFLGRSPDQAEPEDLRRLLAP